MTIVHIVLFEFKPGTTPERIQEVCNQMLSLRDKCLHPTTSKPYLKASMGGRDNSPEGLQGGITHGFVVEFESDEDRNYYVDKDPAHREFVSGLSDAVARAQVIDFAPGQF